MPWVAAVVQVQSLAWELPHAVGVTKKLKIKNKQKTVWHWDKDRHIGQWNTTDSLEINPNISHQIIFYKAAKSIQWDKRQSFYQMVLEKLDIYIQNNEIVPLPNDLHKY